MDPEETNNGGPVPQGDEGTAQGGEGSAPETGAPAPAPEQPNA